jgi:Uncharacterized protein conserved in bacteria (DUF2147)
MRRFCLLALLTLLSSSAHAGSFSFSVGGRRIHIESSRYCRSSSCTSISISDILQSRRKRDDGEPVKPAAAPAAVPTPAVIQPVITPGVAPAPPPPAVFKPAATVTQRVAAPVQPSIVAPPSPPAMRPAIIVPPAPPPPPVAKPIEAVRPSPPARVSQEVADEPADTPLGDWQTEGNGGVRITRCGRALCGYVINASSNERGEAVLVNMKPKSDTQWTGNVYSRDSGDIYYGTMEMKGPNTLRVEACALGRFYCSGNNWSRIIGRTEQLISSRQTSTEPRS